MMKVRGLKASNGARGSQLSAESSGSPRMSSPRCCSCTCGTAGCGSAGSPCAAPRGRADSASWPPPPPAPTCGSGHGDNGNGNDGNGNNDNDNAGAPPGVPQRHQSALARGDTDCPPRLQIKMLNIATHHILLPPLLLMISSSGTLLPEDFCTPGKTNEKFIIILISTHIHAATSCMPLSWSWVYLPSGMSMRTSLLSWLILLI